MPKQTKKMPEPIIAQPPPTPTLLSTLSSSNKQTLITALSHLTTLYPKGNVGPTLTNIDTIRKILQLTRHADKVVEQLALQCLLAYLQFSEPTALETLDFSQVLKGREPSLRLDLYNALLTLDVVRPEVEVRIATRMKQTNYEEGDEAIYDEEANSMRSEVTRLLQYLTQS